MIRTVGLIGTGIMGVPMGQNLLKAGFALVVFNRTAASTKPLLDSGARWADGPGKVTEQCDAVITMLPDSPDVEDAYLQPAGIVDSARKGALCVDMSTVSPETARLLASSLQQREAAFLDAPVSGGKTGAEAGTLVIMVGGESVTLERARPIFQAMGKTIVHCGPSGFGQLAKLCNQILCGLNLLAVSEAMVFARRVGLDPNTMLAAVSGGAAGSWALSNLGPRMIREDFAPMFMIDLQQKDLRIALEMAASAGTPLPGTSLVKQLLCSNQSRGEGREGTQALVKTLERLAGLRE